MGENVAFPLELNIVNWNSPGVLFAVRYTMQASSKGAGKMVQEVKQVLKGFMIRQKNLEGRSQSDLKLQIAWTCLVLNV